MARARVVHLAKGPLGSVFSKSRGGLVWGLQSHFAFCLSCQRQSWMLDGPQLGQRRCVLCGANEDAVELELLGHHQLRTFRQAQLRGIARWRRREYAKKRRRWLRERDTLERLRSVITIYSEGEFE